MKASKLTLPGYLSCLLFVLAGCNNDNKTENSSTKDTTTTVTIPLQDTAGNIATGSSDTSKMGTRTNPGKRTGKVTVKPTAVDKSVAMKTDDKGFYNYTESAPVFSGGQGSLENFIMGKIEYPQDAMDNEVEGTVYVLFTIDENGKVGNAKATGTKLGYGLEEEAIRVVSSMSNWTPGTNNGKKVKAWYTLPITYKLEE